jgi:O-succinylhomoserine sulfhydrylase
MTRKPENTYHTDTLAIQTGGIHTPFGETGEAMFLNSAYTFDSAEHAEARFAKRDAGYFYSRYSNPSLDMLEQRLAAMEVGADRAIVCASGMAAVFASLMSGLKTGDHVLANKVLFSSCYYIITQVLPRFGITYTLVESSDLQAWEAAFKPNTTHVFIESPANPTMELVDIAALAKLAKTKAAKLIVDNVFATPLYQSPLMLGADMVIYSTTKHMDGQGRTLGGAIIGGKALLEEIVLPFVRHTGPHMSPFTAWVVFKGLETLGLRMERHTKNALVIAELLEKSAMVDRVNYPYLASHPQHTLAKTQMSGGGGVLSFYLKGGKAAAFKFMNALKIARISNNLGDAKTLVTHPASSTHASIAEAERAALGITDGLVRYSAGLEATEDLLKDVENALSAI